MRLKAAISALHLCTGLLLATGLSVRAGQSALREKPIQLLAFHPSMTNSEVMELTLNQVSDPSGDLLEYYADVDSVICGDSQCEVITVRLFWDPLGRFLRYTLPNGGNLTKRGHKQFTPEDHKKLATILRTENSLLKDVAAKDVVSPIKAQKGDELDGTTGATLLSDKSAYIPGAIYTCYTLWHWANNDICKEMRDITETEMPDRQLISFLNSGETRRVLFAIRLLKERGIADEATRNAVLRNTETGNTEVAGAGLEYFASLGAEVYYPALEKLFAEGASRKQVLYLMSLLSTDLPAPDGFYDALSNRLPTLGSYYEVHLLLNLMAAENPDSPTVVSNVVALLDNPSFLIGRRAYNFLKDLPLPEKETQKLAAFCSRNANRL